MGGNPSFGDRLTLIEAIKKGGLGFGVGLVPIFPVLILIEGTAILLIMA